MTAIRHVLQGKLYFSEDLIHRVLHRTKGGRDEPDSSPLDALSDRELEVFRFIGAGLTTREIAAHLHLAPSTVETYRERLKLKLGLKSGAELIRYATQWILEAG